MCVVPLGPIISNANESKPWNDFHRKTYGIDYKKLSVLAPLREFMNKRLGWKVPRVEEILKFLDSIPKTLQNQRVFGFNSQNF